jgi:hypothetical protein
MHLQRGPGRPLGRSGAGDLGRRHVPRGGALAFGNGDGRRAEQRPGELEPDRHVGELVLDRLERPDRPAELAPLPGMADAGLQQGAARAEQLRRAGQRARLARPFHRTGHRRTLGQHLAAAGLRQRPGRVHRPVPGARRGQPHGAGLGEQDQPGRVGVRRPGQPRRQGEGGDQVPGGQAGQPPGAQALVGQRGDQLRDRGGRLGHRPRHGVMPELLACDHDVQPAGAEPAGARRYRQRGDAKPRELAPQRQAGGVVPAGPPPCGAGHVGGGEQIMQGRGELLLLG